MLGTIQYGYYFFAAQSASSAARETARRLSVGDCQGTGEAQQFANNQAKLTDPLTLSYGDASATSLDNTLPEVGQVLKVQVQANGKIIGYLPMPNGGLITRTVEALVEDTEPEGSCP